MVAAQPEQLAAQQQVHDSSTSTQPGLNQAVGLDLLPEKPQECPPSEAAARGPAHHPADTEQGPAAPTAAATARLRYFNWDQRDTARAAMNTLVTALSEDPINSYFTGSRRRQRKFVKDEVKGYLKALPRAANFIATSDSKAVALWQLLPAETPRNELWAGWTRILAVSPRKWGQLVRLELHYEQAHEAMAAAHGPYYYLSFIGTAPEARGRGLGGRLLQEITSRADREGRWCLLEATSEKSEALYARHGFGTYEVFRVSRKAPPVFLMKRAPASAAAASAAAASAAPDSAPSSAPAAPSAAGTASAKALLLLDHHHHLNSNSKAGSGSIGVGDNMSPRSPVFSITAVSMSVPCSPLAAAPNGSSISSGSNAISGGDGSSGVAAAVAAKQAAAGSISYGGMSPPASPLIPAGRTGAALDDHLLLPPPPAAAAATAAVDVMPASAAAPGSKGGQKQQQGQQEEEQQDVMALLLPACVPADAQVIIRSASSSSVLAAAAAGGLFKEGAISGFGGSASSGSEQGASAVESGVMRDEAGCDSSSIAGAGGPSAAAAGSC